MNSNKLSGSPIASIYFDLAGELQMGSTYCVTALENRLQSWINIKHTKAGV